MRSASRTAPPTIQASSPSRISRIRSSIDGDPPSASGAGVEARRDLVADRARDARMLLDADAVADERHGRTCGQLGVEQRPRARPWRSSRRRAGARPSTSTSVPGHVAPEAVRVPDRDDTDPGRRDRRRSAARSPCSPPARGVSRARGTTPSEAQVSARRPPDRLRTARSRRGRSRNARRRSAPPRSAASLRCSPGAGSATRAARSPRGSDRPAAA